MDAQITPSQGNISIRPAQEADAQAFRELRLEALRNHPEVFSSDYAVNSEKPAEYWVDRLQALGSAGMIYFATYNAEIIGMCGIRRGDSPKTAHSAMIWGVYVRPEWRGLRVAEELLAKSAEWAQAHGIKIIKLAVVTTNMAAIRCYARCGFSVYGVEPQANYYAGKMYAELLLARVIQD
jgi:RimJ/RimL family protein N-acetyltransferase